MTPTQMKKKIEALEEEIRVYKEDTAWCYMCGKPKKKNRENFYKNTDPLVKSGYAAICSECARKIALRTDENGEEHKPTKESIILALQYLNKPFLENVYNSSVQAAERNAGIPGAKQKCMEYIYKNHCNAAIFWKTIQGSDFFKQKNYI